MKKVKIPVGLENFSEIRTDGCYYFDKTYFIKELYEESFKVNLITRPRRFGKTLTMSMLRYFFDIRLDSRELFEGLEISNYRNICQEWMNQWPVLSLSFKDVAGQNFQSSFEQLAFNLSSLCIEHGYLAESGKVDPEDQERFFRLKTGNATETELKNSLFLLMRMMYMHYGKQVILLLDEYDVPLAKASDYGYYESMLNVVRSIMGTAFKTNDFLKFAVVTGCLRIPKESIFTGTNLLVTNSIYKGGYMDVFGFTEQEVCRLLKDAGLEGQLFVMRRWYAGYRFGEQDVYCPWDVVNHVAALLKKPNQKPDCYWKDTSHNRIIRRFIEDGDIQVHEQFEMLLAGGSIRVDIREDLTYNLEDGEEKEAYFWSILYLTGYLTLADMGASSQQEGLAAVSVRIPNEEVRSVFADTVVQWFKDAMKQQNRDALFAAWWNGLDGELTAMVTDILFETISYFDYREDYYHAFLAGLFAGAGYQVESNRESGFGRADILVKDRKNRRAIVIEIKHSRTERQMQADCEAALRQIEDMQYAGGLMKGYRTVICYGAAFFGKSCLILSSESK